MASEHYPGCWRKHLTCARNTVLYEQTRADFAVDRAREAEALVKRLEGMMLDILRRSASQVTQDAHREIGAIALHALREMGAETEQ